MLQNIFTLKNVLIEYQIKLQLFLAKILQVKGIFDIFNF